MGLGGEAEEGRMIDTPENLGKTVMRAGLRAVAVATFLCT